eukprot:TRINITY_DN10465_c0_g1_i1.p1 TRINITY_DN10465_c0_g1~~TRINITY_DN10465_c0_g1_i1.p1  ORF type:complete len:427 (-),score=44.55 TRINITY_DN10465_c0_g1_i1:526-1806(-)
MDAALKSKRSLSDITNVSRQVKGKAPTTQKTIDLCASQDEVFPISIPPSAPTFNRYSPPCRITVPSSPTLFDFVTDTTMIHIFSFLGMDVLLNCRMVCRNWLYLSRAPLLCETRKASVYTLEVEDVLDERERKYSVPIDYLNEFASNSSNASNGNSSTSRQMTKEMRSILVDWIAEVSEEFDLNPQTLFLSVQYLDRYLSSSLVPRTLLQLLGATCLFVAAKYEEISVPSVSEMVYISDHSCTREDILGMEKKLLNLLHFQLSYATSWEYLHKYLDTLKFIPTRLFHTLRLLSCYLLELSLLDYSLSLQLPSLVAASVLSLALHTMGLPPWSYTLEVYTRFSIEQPCFRKCISTIHEMFLKVPDIVTRTGAVFTKYSKLTNYESIAARFAPPLSLPTVSSPFFYQPNPCQKPLVTTSSTADSPEHK